MASSAVKNAGIRSRKARRDVAQARAVAAHMPIVPIAAALARAVCVVVVALGRRGG